MTIVAKILTPRPVLDVVTMAAEIKAVEDASPKEAAEVTEDRRPPPAPSKTTKNLETPTIIIEPEVNRVKTETEKTAVDRKSRVKKRIPLTIHPLTFSRRQVKVSSKIQIVSKWRQNWPNVESANGRSITKMLAAPLVFFAGEKPLFFI